MKNVYKCRPAQIIAAILENLILLVLKMNMYKRMLSKHNFPIIFLVFLDKSHECISTENFFKIVAVQVSDK